MTNELQVGDLVHKTGGSYEADGYIVSLFTTTAGAQRCVFEFIDPKGMLHIFDVKQVEKK